MWDPARPNAVSSCPLPHLCPTCWGARHSPRPGLRAVPPTLASLAVITHIRSDGQTQPSWRIRSRSHFAPSFIDSTHAPGMGLETENTAGTMELRLPPGPGTLAAPLHRRPGLDSLPRASPNTLCLLVSSHLLDRRAILLICFSFPFRRGPVPISLPVLRAWHRAWVSVGIQSPSLSK